MFSNVLKVVLLSYTAKMMSKPQIIIFFFVLPGQTANRSLRPETERSLVSNILVICVPDLAWQAGR